MKRERCKMAKNIAIEGARILFRNFEGVEERFNRAGDRNFCVALTQEKADELSAEGWNVRVIEPKEDYDDPLYYIKVSVQYKNVPPKVYLLTSRAKTLLNENTVGELDHIDIANADLIISPYHWEVNGKRGVKAYLKTAYITMEEDEFAYKYNDEF